MWNMLLSILSGPLASISKELRIAYQSKLDAKTDAERLLYEERIKVLEAQKEIILKAQDDPIERWVRILLTAPFILYINKLVIWDKVFALGVTDPLGDNLTYIMMLVLGGYFVDTIVRRPIR